MGKILAKKCAPERTKLNPEEKNKIQEGMVSKEIGNLNMYWLYKILTNLRSRKIQSGNILLDNMEDTRGGIRMRAS